MIDRDSALDESAAVTLMSTDVQRICDALPLVHELWASLIEIGLAVWLLQAEIGIAIIGPLVVISSVVALTFTISSRMGAAQQGWSKKIQTRVNATAKALQAMKGVKMLGLTSNLSDTLLRFRRNEVSSSLKVRRLSGYTMISGNTSDIFAPGVAFAIFVIIAKYNGQTLNVSSAYTALSLIALLAAPIKTLSFTIPLCMAAAGCLRRIQTFLLSTSRHDHRLPALLSHNQVHSMTRAPLQTNANQYREDIELRVVPRKKTLTGTHTNTQPSIRVVNCTLAWSDATSPVIKDVSFDLWPGVTMVVGPVGCGKSSLLKGLLGELPSSKGYIYTDSLQIAFVDQSPWIQHGTLRDNIIGLSTFEHKFYSTVVHACALDQDFNTLPQGDLTPVGSGGISLSGGQKLRVVSFPRNVHNHS